MWFGRRKNQSRSTVEAGDQLIADIEAFLSGDYADHVQRRGDRVPGWAWLNRFAHGDLLSVLQVRRATLTAGSAPARETEEAWRSAQQILASELLASRPAAPLVGKVDRTVLGPGVHVEVPTRSPRRRFPKPRRQVRGPSW